jgi:hypothetical protein
MFKFIYLSIFLAFHAADGLRLPKIFTNGMVLQSEPPVAQIWGFLDGNSATVHMRASCSVKGKVVITTQKHIPKQVRVVALESLIRKH